MPFKIYTYEDPYKLDKADFWSEISALPGLYLNFKYPMRVYFIPLFS